MGRREGYVASLAHGEGGAWRFGVVGAGDVVGLDTATGPVVGIVSGCDLSDPKYTSGQVVDVYVEETNTVHKEVRPETLSWVEPAWLGGRRIELDGSLAPLVKAMPPEPSTSPETVEIARAHRDDAGPCPMAKHSRGESVLFREDSRAPLRSGIITSIKRRPYGVFYHIESPSRLTTALLVPERNIAGILSPGNIQERISLCWNDEIDGGSFDFFPVGRDEAIHSYESIDFWLRDRKGACANVDEYDFHNCLESIFEAFIDTSDLVNVARDRQDGYAPDNQPAFDYYGDNFYTLTTCECILAEIDLCAGRNPDDLLLRFSSAFHAVVKKAAKLSCEEGTEFGVMVMGP